MKKNSAELIGTFALVFFGCATILFMKSEVGLLGVSFAFGLTVTAMAYGIGPISGAHLNPAVSLGAYIAGRMPLNELVGYVIAQVIGGILAATVLYFIASQQVGFSADNGFASTTIGVAGVAGALIFELIATFLFVTVILGVTQKGAPDTLAGLVIGLTLVVIHLAGITISGSSVNPARSIATALFAGGEALSQIWLYVLAPLAGGTLAGILHRNGVTSSQQNSFQQKEASAIS
jgi:aquaporin Z